MSAASYQHLGSSGQYFNFRNKANYGLIDKLSVSTFTAKNQE